MTRRFIAFVTARPEAFVLGVCLASFLLRVAIVLAAGTWRADFSGTDIGGLAHGIAEGTGMVHGGVESSRFGPVYVHAWGWALSTWGRAGQLVIQCAQALLLSLAPWGLFRFARLHFDPLPAALSAAACALYPELLGLSATMYADALAFSLWCVQLALYAVLVRAPGQAPPALAFGVCAAALALTKGRFLAFSGILLLFAAAGDPRSLRGLLRWSGPGARSAALAVLAAAVVVAPWSLRNARVQGELLFLETTTGLNLWIGHNENATGTGKVAVDRGGAVRAARGDGDGFQRSPELLREFHAARTEVERDRAFFRDAVRSIRSDPLREVPLSFRKVLYFWTIDPTSALARRPAYWLPWAAVMALAALGALGARRRGESHPLLWSWILAATVLAVVFFVIPRLRYPVYPAVFLFAGLGGSRLLERIRSR